MQTIRTYVRPPYAAVEGRSSFRRVSGRLRYAHVGGRPPRRAQPAATRSRAARRRAAARAGRRRQRQDAGPHPPDRAPDRRARGVAPRDHRHHLHQQGRGRDARAARARSSARRSRAIWAARSTRPVCASCGATPRDVGYERSFAIFDDADQQRLMRRCYDDEDLDPKRFPPAGGARPHLRREEPPAGTRRGSTSTRSATRSWCACYRRYQDRLRANQAMDFDDLLMLTVQLLEGDADGARALPAALPARAGRRVPGHQPRPVPAWCGCSASRSATSWSSATTTRASTRGVAPTSATSSTSSATTPTRTSSPSSRTTARPAPSCARRTRSCRATASATPSASGPTPATATRSRCVECRDEREEARVVVGEVNRAVDDGGVAWRTSRSSTAPTPRAARSRTCWCAPRSRTRSSAARGSTSAPRSRTCSPTCGSRPTRPTRSASRGWSRRPSAASARVPWRSSPRTPPTTASR